MTVSLRILTVVVGVVLAAAFSAFTSADDELLSGVPAETGLETSDQDASDEEPDRAAEGKDTIETPSSSARSETDAEPDEKPEEFDYSTLLDEPNLYSRFEKNLWISRDRKRVVIGGEICLTDGMLEFFACRRGSKEHESIVVLDSPPHLIHASLLVIGAKQGKPAKYEPEFVPPTGEPIEICVSWRNEKGDQVQVRAQDLILEDETKKTMESDWVFTGGLFGVDPDGKRYYLANVTGEVFGVSNFPGSILDVPFESSSDNSSLLYTANSDRIPPLGTRVLLILSRKNSQKPEGGNHGK